MNSPHPNPSAASSPLAKNRPLRWLFFVLGLFFVLLGVIGVFLPVLPTTPFMILAAGCFAKSSQRFHTWLMQHKTFGKLVRNWQARRVIPRHAKWLAWTMMSVSCAMVFWRFWGQPNGLLLAGAVSVVCVLTMVWMARLPSK